jgi:hypothetical protein
MAAKSVENIVDIVPVPLSQNFLFQFEKPVVFVETRDEGAPSALLRRYARGN